MRGGAESSMRTRSQRAGARSTIAKWELRLVQKVPEPVTKIIGDLSDAERVLVGLDLRPRQPEAGV